MKETAARALRRRERFASREEFAARYRVRDAFREWREDYFQAYVEYGSTVQEDGSVELCMPGWVSARLLDATFAFDAWRTVRAPDMPVLALYGERSGRLGAGRDPVAGIRTLFPRCESRMVAGATHTGPMEQPELFERIVREFAG